MANLSVGANQPFHTLASAIAASHGGDTIQVAAGTYVNDWAAIDHDLTITGVGGMAHLASTTAIDNGKAALVVNGNVTLQNLEFSGAHVPDGNGAGIRLESGHLTVLNSAFHDNQEGILAGNNPASSLVVRNSEFAHNGAGDGQTHGLYVGQIASLTVDASSFHDTVAGNQLKSRAAETTVTGSHFDTGAYGANYDLDLPNGGVALVQGNSFEKDDGSSQRAIIHFGGEVSNPSGSLTVTGNTFVSDLAHTTAVLNQTSLPVQVANNLVSGVEFILFGSGAQHDNAVGTGAVSTPAPVTPAPVTPAPVVTAPTPVDTGTATPASPKPVIDVGDLNHQILDGFLAGLQGGTTAAPVATVPADGGTTVVLPVAGDLNHAILDAFLAGLGNDVPVSVSLVGASPIDQHV